jgi:hypothetical protein
LNEVDTSQKKGTTVTARASPIVVHRSNAQPSPENLPRLWATGDPDVRGDERASVVAAIRFNPARLRTESATFLV